MIAQALGIRVFEIEASSCCNLRCEFCPREHLDEKGLMSQETFERFLDFANLREDRDSVAWVGMGEPLLNPRTPVFLETVRSRYPKIQTWIITNGTLLNEEILSRLIRAKLNILDISVNGITAETYEKTMRGAVFSKTIENIQTAIRLIQEKKSPMLLRINYVLTPENERARKEIEDFWRTLGVTHFRVEKLHNRGGFLDGVPSTIRLNLLRCDVVEAIHWISWKGEVQICCHDLKRETTLGNIFDHTREEIEERKLVLKKNSAWPAICKSCIDSQRYKLWRTIDAEILRVVILNPFQRISKRLRCNERRVSSRTINV